MYPITVGKAWDLLAKESTKSDSSNGVNFSSQKDIKESLDSLKANDLLSTFGEWYLEKYRIYLTHEAVPTFWSTFSPSGTGDSSPIKSNQTGSGSSGTLRLVNAVDQLYDEVKRWTRNPVISCYLDVLGFSRSQMSSQLVIQLKNILFSKIPLSFHNHLLTTYSYCFRISRYLRFKNQRKHHLNRSRDEEDINESAADDDDDDILDMSPSKDEGCPVCGKSTGADSMNTDEMSPDDDWISGDNHRDNNNDPSLNSSLSTGAAAAPNCNCSEILEAFDKMNQHLQEMLLLEEITEDAVTSVIHSHIEKYVKHKTRGNFDRHSVGSLLKWVKRVVMGWLLLVYKEIEPHVLDSTEERLTHLAYEIYASIRISQLFDIIIEYPESTPAILDLKGCLDNCTGFRPKIVESLRKSFETRLLHPGVATNDILTAYIQAIRSLRLLDSSGVILQLVCDPIKSYLKGKEDTVRCIITALTDDNSDLIPELVRGTNTSQGDTENMSPSDDEYIIKNWQSWTPDPRDAKKAPKHSKCIRSADIVSILVNVYESKDLFVEEYQRLLAQRFLSTFDINVENERRNLELLTLKFGESDLHSCEVMLQDMTSSKRIDNRINSGEIPQHHFRQFPINCLILSAQFWPEKLDLTPAGGDEGTSCLQLPAPVETGIEEYTSAFQTLKGSRTLNWKKNLGQVCLQLDFGESKGGVKEMTVSPIHACIIYQFQDRKDWRLSDLASCLNVPASVLRRKMVFWQNKQIIRETSCDTYVLLENQDDIMDAGPPVDLDPPSPVPPSPKPNVVPEEDRIIWSYVESMLQNISDMSLERIFTTLQMFAIPGSSTSNTSIQELRTFLDSKVRDGKLVFVGGTYKLHTDPT